MEGHPLEGSFEVDRRDTPFGSFLTFQAAGGGAAAFTGFVAGAGMHDDRDARGTAGAQFVVGQGPHLRFQRIDLFSHHAHSRADHPLISASADQFQE